MEATKSHIDILELKTKSLLSEENHWMGLGVD